MRWFPKARVEALSDGIFAFAMTLLVLDIRLPADLPITSPQELSAQIFGLWPQALTYLISFFVLGALWRAGIELRRAEETIAGGLLRIWLVYLFFITALPFSSALVAHYGHMAPAVWLYAGHMAILGLLTLPLTHFEVARGQNAIIAATRRRMLLFIASAVLAAVIACFSPRHALWAFGLNILDRLRPAPRSEGRRPG
ncbi:putative membrane protein [Azorhizobium sp. AG788]|uniref:TMEM175 family protein n=1 Tax=Azorhizobium sp. AG788 TaxID=2183897 RepID=UPI00105E40D5|nr:TMEM175 family protein [Azorhizobium sp. AG788]TDT94410.1 putative membrane protein [Azorhizobium sp. AG788]